MSRPLPDILPLRPYFRELVWGGRRLGEMFHKELPPDISVGESFELSTCKGQESVVSAGPFEGSNLLELVRRYQGDLTGQAVWDEHRRDLPLLIKLIDAHQDLSIQVHPDDRYAETYQPGSLGKMEAWLVLHSNGGRAVFGLKDGLRRADLVTAVNEGRVEQVVRYVDVHRGDLVFVPPGTVHALCSGVVLYEVQQASDLTFRVYDYDRPGLDGKPRELHLDQAMQVVEVDDRLDGPMAWHLLPGATVEGVTLVDCDYFRLDLHRSGGREHEQMSVFRALTVVQGVARIEGSSESHCLPAGNTALIPAERGFSVAQDGADDLEYLLASPNAQ